MVPQLLHQLARKAIGKRDFAKAMARTLLYNLKGTRYGDFSQINSWINSRDFDIKFIIITHRKEF